jgi:uncharacterized protein (TIGR02246 family)
MHRTLCGAGLIASLIVVGSRALGAEEQLDEAAIRKVQEQQAEAWNQHDAAAYGRLFTEDGDVVNVVGWWWKGRAEIERKLASAFAFVFRESTLTITEVQIRLLSSSVALAHVRWKMVGARTPPGMPEPRQGIELQVLKKHAGKWLIASFQNTNSVPEVPFPSGPPSTGAKP